MMPWGTGASQFLAILEVIVDSLVVVLAKATARRAYFLIVEVLPRTFSRTGYVTPNVHD